jgi:ubiquinone/menaquinone biosynthesis C-methylase UbiE
MTDHAKEITPDRLYYFKRQEVLVEDFEANGLILDIGGGGEGVIGRMKGAQVIAIDTSRQDLENSAPGPLKIVMDACEMQFLDCSFHTATSFLSLIYINEHEKLFREVLRVLVPGGRFLIWEFSIPKLVSSDKDVAAFPVSILLPDNEEISAGFGTVWPDRELNLEYYTALATTAGFQVISKREKANLVYLELLKPDISLNGQFL